MQDTVGTEFAGRRWPVFWLSLRLALYAVLTLGLYRFWQKTRLRRWYWSALRPGGLPLEYVGDPFEKLLGFLIAVVILSFYIGVVNLLLMFASFSLFQGNFAAYLLSFIGVVPLWFYAQYRARRYVLARTRWRGLRFGLAPGAWGFAWRALFYWALTLLSGGLLWPLMALRLEAFRTNRTFLGDTRLSQEGRWTLLYPCLKWLFVAAGLWFCALMVSVTSDPVIGTLVAVLAGLVTVFGLAYARVDMRRRLTAQKRLGDTDLRLRLDASTWRVLWITLSGYALVLLGATLPAGLMFGVFLELQSTETLVKLGLENAPQLLRDPQTWVLITLSIMSYFTIFLVWGALRHAFVTMPLWRHYAQRLVIENPAALDDLQQRPRDEMTQAEGFAEALDVGASL